MIARRIKYLPSCAHTLQRSPPFRAQHQSAARLLGGGPVGTQLLKCDLVQPIRIHFEVAGDALERLRSFEAPLIHVEPAVDLELDRVKAGSRVPVMLRDEPSGVRLI